MDADELNKIISALKETKDFLWYAYRKSAKEEQSITYDRYNAVYEALSIAEKQLPMKVTECVTIGKKLAPICPVCEMELGVTVLAIRIGAKKPNYCMYCGQAVKWE